MLAEEAYQKEISTIIVGIYFLGESDGGRILQRCCLSVFRSKSVRGRCFTHSIGGRY